MHVKEHVSTELVSISDNFHFPDYSAVFSGTANRYYACFSFIADTD